MGTLLETLNDAAAIAVHKPTRISLEKSKQELSISASRASGYYRKTKINVSQIPSLSAGHDEGPLVIDMNFDKVRRTSSGFVPKIIVLSGLNKLKELKKDKTLTCSAWVGDKVKLDKFDIKADDAISSGDLSSKLSDLVQKTYNKKAAPNAPYSDSTYAYVIDIYPFENYCIFRMNDEKYRQKYKLDAKLREVSLDGKPTKVFEQYVDVPEKTDTVTASSLAEQLFDRPNNGPGALGAFVGPMTNYTDSTDMLIHWGAPGSEANNPMIKLMLNVEDALASYQHETATGVHKVTYSPYAPIPPGLINAGREAKIAAQEAGLDLTKFAPMDFFRWQDKRMRIKASERRKFVNGKALEASQFAYVGEGNDISTWQLACNTKQAAIKSLNDLQSCQFVPKAEKKDVHAAIVAAAKCPMCGNIPCTCKGKKAGGPHTGKGKSSTKAIKEMNTKRNPIDAGGPGSGRHQEFEHLGPHKDVDNMVKHLEKKGYVHGGLSSRKDGGLDIFREKYDRPITNSKLDNKKYNHLDRIVINNETGEYSHYRITKGKSKNTSLGSGVGLDDNFKQIGRTN